MIQTYGYWLALAVTVLVFWRLPLRLRLPFLAAASAAYLLSLDPLSVGAVLAWSVLFYLLPRWASTHRWKRVTSALVLAILGFLVWFKYLPALLALAEGSMALRVAIPLGISYYSVKLIHYAVEVSRGRLPPHRFADFACYMLLFPIFTAGPVERFDSFLARHETQWRGQMAVEGLTRIVHGLIKRFVLAEALLTPRFGLGEGAAGLLQRLDSVSPAHAWAFFALSYLFFYLEFSAYSDIAIGASRLFGLRICENFNWPVLATSLGDFWRRWHMSLSAWCRNYVYLPMIGLTRNPYAASYASFVAMGLWHSGSWHWLLWGAYHATGLALYTRWTQLKQRRKWRFTETMPGNLAGWALTFLFVTSASAIVALERSGTPYDLLRVCCKLLGLPPPA